MNKPLYFKFSKNIIKNEHSMKLILLNLFFMLSHNFFRYFILIKIMIILIVFIMRISINKLRLIIIKAFII